MLIRSFSATYVLVALCTSLTTLLKLRQHTQSANLFFVLNRVAVTYYLEHRTGILITFDGYWTSTIQV